MEHFLRGCCRYLAILETPSSKTQKKTSGHTEHFKNIVERCLVICGTRFKNIFNKLLRTFFENVVEDPLLDYPFRDCSEKCCQFHYLLRFFNYFQLILVPEVGAHWSTRSYEGHSGTLYCGDSFKQVVAHFWAY